MNGECHAHLFMDGIDYKKAVARHKEGVDREQVRMELEAYQKHQVSYIRDGGDRFGVSVYARSIAEEYGIEYRTPVFSISRKGHYGRIVGRQAESLKEVAELVKEVKRQKGDFVKIMVSGIMEYSGFGRLSEEALEKEWIQEMIHIAHEEGMAVMVHGNGREAVLPAVLAGADSIEHGNYIDEECLLAMKEMGCIWVPTIVTTKNLIHCGRYDDLVLEKIYQMERENLSRGAAIGVKLACGSDAGAYRVLHGKGLRDEEVIFQETLSEEGWEKERILQLIDDGEMNIRNTFKGEYYEK